MSSNSLLQVEDRFRKTNHSSPEAQSKQTGRVLEPPVPSRSESFSNGNSESVHPALQRPAEPQVATASFSVAEETCVARWALGLLITATLSLLLVTNFKKKKDKSL